jgi:hypothetical protein
MKKLMLFVFSLITLVGGTALLATPAKAAALGECTAPKGLPATCWMVSCTCSNGWCTSTWQCP